MLIVPVMLLAASADAATVYETRDAFIQRAFSGSPPKPSMIWLKDKQKSRVQKILGHAYPALRLRYWCRANRSAWILEEIGKELPITIGTIIDDGQIKSLRVLIYRENRGGEVSTPAFTDQFDGVALAENDTLDAHIDGISGATLSVQALNRLARVALFLHTDSTCADDL